MGLTTEQFWEITPGELLTICHIERERREREAEERNRTVYAQAVLTARFLMAEKIPTFDEIFHPEKAEEEKEGADLLELVRGLNRAFGGREENAPEG